MNCIANVKTCRDGWVYHPKEKKEVLCICNDLLKINRLYDENGFDPQLKRTMNNLDDSVLTIYKKSDLEKMEKMNDYAFEKHKKTLKKRSYKQILKGVMEHIENLTKEKSKFVLFGDPGAGKSQFSSTLALELLAKGLKEGKNRFMRVESYFLETRKLYDAAFDFSDYGREQLRRINEKVNDPNVKVLVLDDIGSEISKNKNRDGTIDNRLLELLTKYNGIIRDFNKKEGIIIMTCNDDPFTLKNKYEDYQRLFDMLYQEGRTRFYKFEENEYRQKQKSRTLDELDGENNG